MTVADLTNAMNAKGVQDSDTVFYISLKQDSPPLVTRRVLSDGTTYVVEVVN